MDLSIVIPIFNEQENLPILYSKLVSVLKKLGKNYEIVFVNDGSTDSSFSVLKDIKVYDKNILIINFRKNFGQTAALDAGFKHARGDVIVTLDADLQNDPEEYKHLDHT